MAASFPILRPLPKKSVAFPIVGEGAQTLLLPIMGQGKAIPTTDKTWLKYLVNNFGITNKQEGTAGLSMQFLGAIYPKFPQFIL